MGKNKDHNIQKNEFSFEIIRENDNQVRLVVRTDKPMDGVADVFIDYDVEKNDGILSKLMIR